MPKVLESILSSIKKLNNVAADYTAFDNDFIMYINSALSDLHQVGIGPVDGFQIEGVNDTWDDFIGEEPRLNGAKIFVALKVNLLFDPPNNSFAIEMKEKQLDEALNRVMWAQQDIDAEEEAG